MRMNTLKTGGAALIAMGVAGLLIPRLACPVGGAETKPGAALSAEMTQAEAKVAKVRELVGPKPGEHVTNMAKIAWEHDPWEAAVKAGREGKPILAWGECGAGVPCGYG